MVNYIGRTTVRCANHSAAAALLYCASGAIFDLLLEEEI